MLRLLGKDISQTDSCSYLTRRQSTHRTSYHSFQIGDDGVNEEKKQKIPKQKTNESNKN